MRKNEWEKKKICGGENKREIEVYLVKIYKKTFS